MTQLNERTYLPDVIKSEVDPVQARKLVTIASGAGVLKKGTVLGTVTASGKMVPYDPTSNLGPQLATVGLLAILGADVDATAADVPNALVWYALCSFSTAKLIWGAGVTTQNHKNTAYAGLALSFAIARTPG
jgi:hypothetical protein